MNNQRNKKQPVTDIQGAANYMMVPVETIQSLIEKGQLRHTRIGSFIRCRYLDLDHYIRRNTTGNRELFNIKQSAEIHDLIDQWDLVFGSEAITPADLNNLCEDEGLLLDKRGNNGVRSQTIRLGKLLCSIKNYDFNGLHVMRKPGRKGMVYYLSATPENATFAPFSASQTGLPSENFDLHVKTSEGA